MVYLASVWSGVPHWRNYSPVPAHCRNVCLVDHHYFSCVGDIALEVGVRPIGVLLSVFHFVFPLLSSSSHFLLKLAEVQLLLLLVHFVLVDIV